MKMIEFAQEIELSEKVVCDAYVDCIACVFPSAIGILFGSSDGMIFSAALGSDTTIVVASGNA